MAGASGRRSRPTSPPPSRRPSAADLAGLSPDRALVARFGAALDRLSAPGRIGLAVSGGADSTALLLLAAAARPQAVEALSVDHGLRKEAGEEIRQVAALCARLGVPHHALRIDLAEGGSLQARAREGRYMAMAEEVRRRGLGALATAHHADDQAETLLMRLARGSGLGGLAGVRETQSIAGVLIIRPLLDWRKAQLLEVCETAGVAWSEDPSNHDRRFDRSSVRAAMTATDLDPAMLSRSARHLAAAEEALDWLSERESGRLAIDGDGASLDPRGIPAELVRRLLLRAFAALGAPAPRGPDLERATAALHAGGPATLSGLHLAPEPDGRWSFQPEAPRR